MSETKQPRRNAFSLIELMVAMSVLALLMVLLTSVLSGTQLAIGNAGTRTDSDARARRAFAVVGRDLGRQIQRADAPMEFLTQPGNDEFSLFAEAAGYAGDRGLSAVRYRLAGTQLLRGATGQEFGDAEADGSEPEILLLDDAVPPPAPAAEDLVPLEGKILRMEIGFLDRGNPTEPFVADWPGRERAAALVLTLALAGDGVEPLLTDAILQALADTLVDAADAARPAPAWEAVLAASPAGIPEAVTRAVRVYQRVFLLE